MKYDIRKVSVAITRELPSMDETWRFVLALSVKRIDTPCSSWGRCVLLPPSALSHGRTAALALDTLLLLVDYSGFIPEG